MKKMVFKTAVVSIMLMLVFSLNTLAKSGWALIPHLSDGGGECKAAYRYYNEDGSKAVNKWEKINEEWYYFGEDGISKQGTWSEIEGKWYYFDDRSVMLHDTTTPDGYYVGSDGAWVTE